MEAPDFSKLAAPFPPDKIEWRVGPTNQQKTKGMALAYIDARDVMQRLDDVCGPDGWQCRYPHANSKTVCEIGLRVRGEWVWKSDGAGDTDHEGIKGALSDAFKRAAVRWGIGRYLYDMDTPWVNIQQRGRSYIISDDDMKRLHGRQPPTPPDGPEPRATPDEWLAYAERVAHGVKSAPDAKDLEAIWKSEKEDLACLKLQAPETYQGLVDTFSARKAELNRRKAA